MKPSIVPKMTFKGHSMPSAMSSFLDSLDDLWETGKIGYTYFETKK